MLNLLCWCDDIHWLTGLYDKTHRRTFGGWISHKRLVIVCDIYRKVDWQIPLANSLTFHIQHLKELTPEELEMLLDN